MLPWLAPPAIENPVGSRSKRHFAFPHIPYNLVHTVNAQPKSPDAEMCFDLHLRLDAWTLNNAADPLNMGLAQLMDKSWVVQEGMSWLVAKSWALGLARRLEERT